MQWLRQRWILLTSVAATILLYALLGFLLVPKLARSAITHYVQDEMHRKVSIGDLQFNPFTLTAVVNQFSLSEADDTPIASFDSLLVNLELTSITLRGEDFKEIRIDNPSVLVRVNADGSLNLAQLAPPSDASVAPADKASPDNAPPEKSLPRIRIGTFAVHSGQVKVEDRSRPSPFAATLTPIEFSLTNFSTEPKFGNQYRFVAATQDNESLEWSGEFTVQPLGSTGRFALANIKATTIAAYLQDALPFHLPAGILDVTGEYQLALQDRIDLHINLPQITARDFALAVRGSESQAPWIVAPQVSITDTALSLADRKLTVGAVQVTDTTVDLWRDTDGSINIVKLFGDDAPMPTPTRTPTPTSTPTKATTSQPIAPWSIDVKTVQLHNARVNFADKSITPNARVSLTPINATITDYSNAADAALTVDTTIGFDGKGAVTISGPAVMSPLAANLKVAVKQLDLTLLQPYIAQSTAMTLHSGQLSTETFVNYAIEPTRGQPQLKVTGDITVDNLLTKDNALKQDFIKWQSLNVSGISFEQAPDRLVITRVHARKPYGRVIISEQGNINVSQILNPPHKEATTSQPRTDKQASQAPPRDNSAAMPIRINTVTVEDGSASFADYSVTPSFATEIASLKGSITGLSSAKDSRAKVQLKGSVDTYAPVSIDGELNLLATDKYSDIAMSFRNIELTTFNPYSGKFAGYNISKGKLSTEMQYKVNNRELNASHHIVVDQLEFGDATASKDAVSLPIKLAVALLKDKDGVINLNLPVSGNLDDPKFRIGPIIWQVFKNTLEKIVTAPFALLGSLFGGGEELSYVDFAAGSSTLTPSEADKLAKLKHALIERPQLKLDVPLQAIGTTDSAAMAQLALEQAVTAATKPNSDRLTALAKVYTNEFGKPAVYPENPSKDSKDVDVVALRMQFLEGALLNELTPSAAQLDELARSRGNAVRDALLANGEIAAERVFLTGRTAMASPQQGVRLELKLE